MNRLVWDSGYIQVVGEPTRVDSLLDVYLVRLHSYLAVRYVQGISDNCRVLLEVDWVENIFVTP